MGTNAEDRLCSPAEHLEAISSVNGAVERFGLTRFWKKQYSDPIGLTIRFIPNSAAVAEFTSQGYRSHCIACKKSRSIFDVVDERPGVSRKPLRPSAALRAGDKANSMFVQATASHSFDFVFVKAGTGVISRLDHGPHQRQSYATSRSPDPDGDAVVFSDHRSAPGALSTWQPAVHRIRSRRTGLFPSRSRRNDSAAG